MSRRVNLIPMAGAGRRFADRGYRTPKPLIDVAGVPMILRAAACLPPADQWIFNCRAEHLADSDIGAVLQSRYPGCLLVPIPGLTEGQASTCLAARDHLQPDDALTVGACDNAMTYDLSRFAEALADGADVLIWTFRHNPAVLPNPRMYGWVDATADGRARRVSVKVPLSDTPMEDHAVIGSFTFRRAADFFASIDRMIAANRRIHNEFYVDEAVNLAIEGGLRVMVFEVDRYICWGTPQDLDVFNYWHGYFAQTGL